MVMEWSDFNAIEKIFEKGKIAAQESILLLQEKIIERKKETQMLHNS